jgi:CubicO group peptidase (beta-lactamase class C family)
MRLPVTALIILLSSAPSLAWAQRAHPPYNHTATNTPHDAVDRIVADEMEKQQIPGLSLAVMQGGKIVKAKGYGVTEKGGKTAVTAGTLLQAGSVSKSVAAVGALHLVSQGKLSLDEDVNVKLLTWKVPRNEFNKEQKVTLRRLLSHTAGLTVHGFPGYARDAQIPSLVQVLDGKKPANTSAIRVEFVPGSKWNYSGSGYTVMQKLVMDVTGKPFPQFMGEAVLGPAGMRESTFKQPLPAEKARLAAAGEYANHTPVHGKWHIYPEMAAAGLWTTPSDLMHFASAVQDALAGKSSKILSKKTARQMLTEEKDHDGLGVFLQGTGKNLRFSHNGRNEGFDTLLVAYAESGRGAAIMINANEDSGSLGRILKAIESEYRWP